MRPLAGCVRVREKIKLEKFSLQFLRPSPLFLFWLSHDLWVRKHCISFALLGLSGPFLTARVLVSSLSRCSLLHKPVKTNLLSLGLGGWFFCTGGHRGLLGHCLAVRGHQVQQVLLRVEDPLFALLPLQPLHFDQLGLPPPAICAEADVAGHAVLFLLSCEVWHGGRATRPEGEGLLLAALLLRHVDWQLDFAFVGLFVDRLLDLLVDYG